MRQHRQRAVTTTLALSRDPSADITSEDAAAFTKAVRDGVDFSNVDFRDPTQAADARRDMTRVAVRVLGWSRDKARLYAVQFAKLRSHEGPGDPHTLGSSMVEVLAALRSMGPGATDETAPWDAKRERNRKKRERKARAARCCQKSRSSSGR